MGEGGEGFGRQGGRLKNWVLLAAPPHVARELKPAFDPGIEVLTTNALEEAIGLLRAARPQLMVLSYVFDEMRPFALLTELQQEGAGQRVPILLVRATPVSLGESHEAQVREAYESLGVVQFFNMWEARLRHGRQAALERFREAVRQLTVRPQGGGGS